MTLFDVAQIQLVVVCSITSTLLATSPRLAYRAFWLSLFNQWAWFYTALHGEAYGLLIVNVIYTINHIRGICRYRRYRSCASS